MGFREYLESKELEDEIKKLSLDDYTHDDEDIDEDQSEEDDIDVDQSEEDDIDVDDIDSVMDLDDDGESENQEDYDLNEAKQKNVKELLQNRFKKKAREVILKNMQGIKDGEQGKIAPITVAMFHVNYEFNKDMGKFGKWLRRKNKSEFKKKNPISKLVKAYKGKAKRMRKLLKKGNVQAKIKRGSSKNAVKLGGRDVSATGKITKG
jgi:hypothetical protein